MSQVRGHSVPSLAFTVFCLSVASSANAQVVNLALHQPYVANCDTLPGWEGLTDGCRDSDEPPECFATDNSAKFPKRVVIDLGGLCKVTRVVLHNSLNGNTKLVVVELSQDAKEYEPLRTYVFPPDKHQPLVHHCTARKARFVRVTFKDTWGNGVGGRNIIYLREVEVYGTRLQAPATSSERLWQLLAIAKPYRDIPSWPAARRYISELGREVRVVLVTDLPLDLVAGPHGWLTRGLSQAEGSEGKGSVAVQALAYEGGGAEQLFREFRTIMLKRLPDLIVLAPSSSPAPAFTSLVEKVAASARSSGASTVVCIPPPDSSTADGVGAYQSLRRTLLALASAYGAGVLDLGAVFAGLDEKARPLQGKRWAASAVDAAARSFAHLLGR